MLIFNRTNVSYVMKNVKIVFKISLNVLSAILTNIYLKIFVYKTVLYIIFKINSVLNVINVENGVKVA